MELWSGSVTIPALSPSKERVGRNTITHFPTEDFVTSVILYDDERSGYKFFTTSLPFPFDKFYLREKGARRVSLDRGILMVPEESSATDWSADTRFRWDDNTAITGNLDSAESVRVTWKGAFQFQNRNKTSGLRPAQLGALHAISAHFSVGQNPEPATVVLPTGTGKTETMLASLAYDRPKGLLVLVPSDALRTQIAEKFEHFGVLRDLGCLDRETVNPRVARLTTGVRSIEDAKGLVDRSNVIVALPNTLEVSEPEAARYLCESCEQLFIDEAHHLGASTWKRIRDRFLGKKVVQFTATPFRNDKKHIGGRIVFNYKLSDAQRDRYYKQIRLETVEEYGDEFARDKAIAERAIEVLRKDRDEDGFDHLLMARADSKSKAEELLSLYQRLAPDLNPVAAYTGPGRKSANAAAVRSLRESGDSGSRIIVCVDMLGEGFDLPQLKIAAVHDKHKSLAVTLQFVGRFTRDAPSVGDAAVVVNIADREMEKRLERLYAEGADWDKLISRLSEDQIDDELQLQDVVESLKSGGSLHDKISLWNLNPSYSTQVYRTKCENWSPLRYREAFRKDSQLWHSLSAENNVLVVVGYHESLVKWGRYEELVETSYDLMIALWNKEKNALFLYASNYDRMRVTRVADYITNNAAELLNGPRIFNVLNNVELPLAKSLGSSRIGAISFTSYFGPNVTEGLASIEKSESQLNHIACLGYENGDKVLWGAAEKKAKVWQHRNGTINDWIKWCGHTYGKLEDDSGDETNITRDFLRPKKLDALYHLPPISIQWGEYLQSSFSDYLSIYFGETEVPLYLADIEIVESSTEDEIRFAFFTDTERSVYSLRLGGSFTKGYQYIHEEGPKVAFRVNRNTVREFDDQAYIDPPIIRYADGTFSYNNFHVPFNLDAGNYAPDRVEDWDWSGISLNKESMGIGQEQDTIQYRVYSKIKDEYSIVFNDDGAGEAADLVALRDIDSDEIVLTLIHCKGAYGGKVSSDIRNLYTVCGQAQKSIAVKHEGLKKLSIDLRRRHDIWARRGGSRILKGDLKTLAYYVEKSRKAHVKFEVLIVQPGISADTLSADMSKLLATTELFLKRTTEADFRVIGS